MSKEVSLVQKAGNGSTQVSANNLTIITGVSRAEAEELVRCEREKIIQDATKSAAELVNKRLETFGDVLIDRLSKTSQFNAFKDPAFQKMVRRAAEVASCTDMKSDYELLSELLSYRAERPDEKAISASIKKAIAELDNISSDALSALTIIFAITEYHPTSGNIEDGLGAIDSMLERLLNFLDLPQNYQWIDNLETVGAIRINSLGNLKKYEDIVSDGFSGYCTAGIKKDSEEYNRALDILSANRISETILVDNILIDGYVRLNTIHLNQSDNVEMNDGREHNETFMRKQQTALMEIAALYSHDENVLKEVRDNYLSMLYKYSHIRTVSIWWNRLVENKCALSVTSVGRVLASTNARRLIPSLPELSS